MTGMWLSTVCASTFAQLPLGAGDSLGLVPGWSRPGVLPLAMSARQTVTTQLGLEQVAVPGGSVGNLETTGLLDNPRDGCVWK